MVVSILFYYFTLYILCLPKMAFFFDPVIVEKIFTALTYFRTWVILFLFPVVCLCPDIALIFFKSIFFPNPTDVIIYNENDYKLQQKQIKIQQLRDVVSPFDDDNVNLKNVKKESNKEFEMDNRMNLTPSKQEKEKEKQKLKSEKEPSPQLNEKNAQQIKKKEPIIENKNIYHKPPSKSNPKLKDNKQLEDSEDSINSNEKDVESKRNFKEKPKYKKVIVKDKKKDSVFEDMDFEMKDGKSSNIIFYFLFN